MSAKDKKPVIDKEALKKLTEDKTKAVNTNSIS